jgi:hypothetical protein
MCIPLAAAENSVPENETVAVLFQPGLRSLTGTSGLSPPGVDRMQARPDFVHHAESHVDKCAVTENSPETLRFRNVPVRSLGVRCGVFFTPLLERLIRHDCIQVRTSPLQNFPHFLLSGCVDRFHNFVFPGGNPRRRASGSQRFNRHDYRSGG